MTVTFRLQAGHFVGRSDPGEGRAVKAVRFDRYGDIDVLQLARLAGATVVEVPIARVYPLDEVREAYRELEHRHTRGKIVLRP
jgi:NADPH:quinone reductase-like Zn-dependent oxidoreductase